jgi:hypothetical protein
MLLSFLIIPQYSIISSRGQTMVKLKHVTTNELIRTKPASNGNT